MHEFDKETEIPKRSINGTALNRYNARNAWSSETGITEVTTPDTINSQLKLFFKRV